MSELIFSNVSVQQLVAFGDAALRMGSFKTAAQLYRLAVKRSGGAATVSDLARVDLARVNNSRILPMLDVMQALHQVDPRNVFVGDGLATWLKPTPFGSDARYMELADKHAGLLPLVNWHWNLQTVLWAVQHTQALNGAFVELGVFKGHTTAFVAEYLGFETWDKTWFLYDTFEGIPEDQLDPGWAANNAATYGGTFTFEEVRDRFAPYPNIKVIKGRVPEILAEDCPEAISFIHMDLNNTTAEIQALDALFDRLTPGGVIVFDDYGWTAAFRQREAEDAWFAARGLKILPLPTGQGLFVKP
ncbi:MAG: TylF/MycF/NovP-related O-methyltransferase [Phenylobacterium sp.]